MSTNKPINTFPIQQFIGAVKSADTQNAKEIKIDIKTAKELSFTLGMIMARLNGDLEQIIAKSSNEEEITINLDGGSGF